MGVVIKLWVWVVCISVASGCCCKEVYYIDFLILHIPTPLVLALFCSSIPSLLLCSVFKLFFINMFNKINNFFDIKIILLLAI